MTIATWNVERISSRSRKLSAVESAIEEVSADILILTETHACLTGGDEYSVHGSLPLSPEEHNNYYKAGELRIAILSRYPVISQIPVTNPWTTACTLVQTPVGPLAVYGCIIGVTGRGGSFYTDLAEQISDLHRIGAEHPICYAGDFNLSFCDNYFPNKKAKGLLEETFDSLRMRACTGSIPATIDHIVLSESFLADASVQTHCWNEDKKLSDHKGVALRLQY